jgi:hypothetical protein
LLDGRLVDCRFAPLTGGATLTAFKIREVAATAKVLLDADTALRRA